MSDVQAAGEHEDAEWYSEWFVEDGSIRSRGWFPLLGVDHDGLTDWRHACEEAVKEGVDPDEYEGEVVFRSWAYRDKTGVSWEALADGIEDPQVPA